MAVNATSILTDAATPLGAQTLSDLFTMWDGNELYDVLDRASQHLARHAGVRVQYQAVGALAAGQAVYAVPANYISPLAEFIGGAHADRKTVAQLEALSAEFLAMVSDVPDSTVLDLDGSHMVRVFPAPGVSGATLEMLHHAMLPAVSWLAPTINVPEFLGEYLFLSAVRDAREREGPHQLLDVAQTADQMMQMIQAAAEEMYGGSL